MRQKHILQQYWKLNNSEQILVPTLDNDSFTLEDVKDQRTGFGDKSFIARIHEIDYHNKTIGNWKFKPKEAHVKILPMRPKIRPSQQIRENLK